MFRQVIFKIVYMRAQSSPILHVLVYKCSSWYTLQMTYQSPDLYINCRAHLACCDYILFNYPLPW